MDLDPAERDDLSWWLPITTDETPEEATSRRKRRRAAERRQDARLAAEHEASVERDRKLRAERKRQQRRDEGRPTQEERAARAQADRDEAARCGVTPAAIRQRRWRARLSQSCPLGPPHPLPDVTVASTRGLYGVPTAPTPAQVATKGLPARERAPSTEAQPSPSQREATAGTSHAKHMDEAERYRSAKWGVDDASPARELASTHVRARVRARAKAA